MPGFTPSLSDLRDRVSTVLFDFIEEVRGEIPDAGELLDEIERTIAAGGKRLRPSFCYWGFRAAGGPDGTEIVRAAASLELLHTFAVIHDDIMDASPMRRRAPTSYALLGLDRALLAGDLALVLADDLFARSGFAGERVGTARVHYSAMQRRVIAGQYLDVVAAHHTIDVDEARRIAVMKSGSYSVEDPMLIGAVLAGASADLLAGIAGFGRPLGEAFQHGDDLLGVFGDPAITGKSAEADIRDGKRNYLFATTVSALAAEERDRFLTAWGTVDLTSDELSWVRATVERSGGRARTEDLCNELLSQARNALDAIDIDEEARAALATLADAIALPTG